MARNWPDLGAIENVRHNIRVEVRAKQKIMAISQLKNRVPSRMRSGPFSTYIAFYIYNVTQ